MPTQTPLSQWRETVSMAFPKLSYPQTTVLALWSYGMVLAKSCGITSMCAALALQTGDYESTLTQRLREWCGLCQRQERSQTSKRGGDDVFRAAVGLGAEFMVCRRTSSGPCH